MTRYLIRKGHKKIALLAGREDNLHTRRRLKGYQNALFDAQILYNPRLVRYVDWNKPSGYQETKRLLKEDHRYFLYGGYDSRRRITVSG